MSNLIKVCIFFASISSVICDQDQDFFASLPSIALKREMESNDRKPVEMMLSRLNHYAIEMRRFLNRIKSERTGRGFKSESNFANKVICFPRGCIDISDVGIHP
ncbi:hypothetical protein TcasGA2_TC032300 [Tribolium castaneum]|uniref:Uncharacterized protein n=1 Tax=Tribolium castaneum TaxID=7070 RepID=A0A139WLY7_TRICA|nr:PREDICTED: uncharacterized protein LOC103312228 [Tribolium castaneum]KYB28960.1 hypothetical protein TcasGA2_TC032300 [Tribolium castaneum]|eukprot:XP_015832977.1 PREDICTED: uncharacterized protein LOC103312228 [Tribolium castaneum]